MEKFIVVTGVDTKELFAQVIKKRWAFEQKVNSSGDFEGVSLLADGRVMQVDCNFGWYRSCKVFPNIKAWDNYREIPAHDINPALKFN